jgi:hypothetical protein
MPDQLAIYNMALGGVSARAKLTDIGQNVREAEVCNMFYDLVLKEAFSMAYWPSLRKTSRLAVYAERDLEWDAGQPNPRWGYAYTLPADHIRPRYLQGYTPFELENVGDTFTLQTSAPEAILTYTARRLDPNSWEPALVSLVIAMLAIGRGAEAEILEHFASCTRRLLRGMRDCEVRALARPA